MKRERERERIIYVTSNCFSDKIAVHSRNVILYLLKNVDNVEEITTRLFYPLATRFCKFAVLIQRKICHFYAAFHIVPYVWVLCTRVPLLESKSTIKDYLMN